MRRTSILPLGALLLSGCLVSASGRPTGRQPPPPPPPAEHHHDHGGPPPRPMPAECSLEGMITDAQTGQPLNKAAIDIVDPQGRTQTVQVGPDGHYRFGNLPPGKFAIRCRLDGYDKFEQGYSITDGPARLDCRLRHR